MHEEIVAIQYIELNRKKKSYNIKPRLLYWGTRVGYEGDQYFLRAINLTTTKHTIMHFAMKNIVSWKPKEEK